jgi:hypothetical protein
MDICVVLQETLHGCVVEVGAYEVGDMSVQCLGHHLGRPTHRG